MSDTDIFEIFEKQADEFNVHHLAKALTDAVEGIGYPPRRLRVFTSRKAFDNNVASLKRDKTVNILFETSEKINAQYDGTDYFYTVTDKVALKEEDIYNSIFLGVGYTKNSFNRFSILKRGTFKGVDYYVYVSPKAPKCLRVGVIAEWSDNDLKRIMKISHSHNFDDEPLEDNQEGEINNG